MTDPLKERENLYKLMISQLRYDGFEAIASTLAKVVNIISACPPMARLHQVVNLGIQAETEGVKPETITIPGLTPPIEPGRGIDLEYEPEGHEVNGGSETTSADESFMNNLELQKVTEEPENVPMKSKEDNPSASDVLHHILHISSAKRPLYPVQDSNTLLPMASSTLDQGASAMDVVEQVKIELVKYKVSQEVFAKAVLGKSQGYLSEILKHGDSMFTSSDQTHCRGWLNFETMREFLKKSEAERLRIYQQKGDELKLERMKRRHMDMGGTSAEPPIKRRRCIQPEAKAFMEDYYNCYNRYLSTEKRELLANVLAIPEQCVSDFFKNLRSRRKCEERMQCSLKGLEYPEEQQENVTVTENCDVESHNASKPPPQLPSRSDQTEAEVHTSVTQTAVKNQSLYRVSLYSNCASTSKPVTSHNAFSADLVVSKIAALTQSQQIQSKRAVSTNVHNSASCKIRLNDHIETFPATSAHSLSTEHSMMGQDTAATVESFSLDNIPAIDGCCSPVLLHGGTPDMQNLEVGQQIYVVNVNNSV